MLMGACLCILHEKKAFRTPDMQNKERPLMASEQDFQKIYSNTSMFEGIWSDHPEDRGGETKFGISRKFLESLGLNGGDLNGDGKIDCADVLEVDAFTARELLQMHFWTKPGIWRLPDVLAMVTFDFAVNAGARQAVKVLQRAIQKATGMLVKDDGLIGPVTLSAACSMPMEVKFEAARLALDGRRDFYCELTQRKPDQRVFLKGWLNRCAVLERMLTELEKAEDGR